MVMQYLADEGYNASQMTIQDEANVKWHEREENTNETRRLKKAILGMGNMCCICSRKACRVVVKDSGVMRLFLTRTYTPNITVY